MLSHLRKAVLIGGVCIALVTPAFADSAAPNPAQGLARAEAGVLIGIVAVGAAVAAGVVFLVLHEKHKTSAITGCVASGAAGMTVIDDKDKRAYTLSGDPLGIKSGERMTLEGKRRMENGKNAVFEARSVIKDYGACKP